ncbi:Protein phosphatase 1D [Armadillidium vulgare]|nr:Protein phosphatase 1D [Armadillidium vulgare]
MASRVGVNLRVSAYLHQGDRKYMEDEFQVAYQRTHDKKDIEYAFFGIFDGHGGKEAAHFAKDNLMDNIVSQRLFWSENDDDVLCAIKEGFLQTHMAMWKELDQWPRTASGWPSTSGTTASIAFIRRQKIYIGHVGDSGIVLGHEASNHEWVGIPLTTDHKPENLLEMNRIAECGGKVIAKSGVPRVVWNRPKSGHQGPVRRSTPMDEIPFLAVARSLGDLWSYNATNNQFVVSPEPDVCVIDIDVNHHRFLIFGTDGLWNALSPNTAVNIAYNSEKNNEKHYLGVPLGCGKQRLWINPSRCIVSGALERYQRVHLRADNTSAITVFLDPPGRPKREVLLQQMSLKKGSVSKNGGSNKSPNRKAKEASVKVHVYTSKGEGGQGTLCIKERLPEFKSECVNEENSHCTPFQGEAEPEPSHISGENLVNFVSKSVCSDSYFHFNKDEENLNVRKSDSSAPDVSGSACAECDYINRSSGHSHFKGSSSVNSSNNENSISSNSSITGQNTNFNIKPKNDDIQIPLVSSSTSVEGVEDELKSSNSDTCKSQSKHEDISTKRRTRSCMSLPLQLRNENKKHSLNKTSHLSKESSTISYEADSCSRILKSVNRGSCINNNNISSKEGRSSFITPKRKRSREFQQEERLSKSLRVHTRSHTMNYKSMITRSQEKNRKVK